MLLSQEMQLCCYSYWEGELWVDWGTTSSALWGIKDPDEQSPASMNHDSVAFCVCKQTGVALGLFEFHSSSHAYHDRTLQKIHLEWNDCWGKARCVKVGVSHQRKILARTYRAAVNHIKASTETPLAAAAAADGVWCVKGMILLAQPHSCHYIPFMAYCLSHDLTFTLSSGEIICQEFWPRHHTHILLQLKPPSLPLSWLRACIHTCTHIFSCHLGSDTIVLGFDRKSIQLTDECS